MSGFVGYVGGQLIIEKDDRLVLSTGDTLVQFLTAEQTFSQNCAFPDVPKGEIYVWEYDVRNIPGGYNVVVDNVSCVGARPQDWETQIVLGTVPAGADIFWGKITLSRIVGPSHPWGNESLATRVTQNQAMQITGSMLLEQVRGLSRVLSVFISGGNLVVDMQQSCGPVSGNFGAWGQPLAEFTSTIGGTNSAPSGAGKYVHTAHTGFTGSNILTKFSSTFPEETVLTFVQRFQNGAANEAPYSDPTNYGVTYAITVKGRFGRRS